MPPSWIGSETRLRDWLNELEGRLEKLGVAYNLASFNQYIGRPSADLNKHEAAFSTFLTDPTTQATLRHWLNRTADPNLQRRLSLFQQACLEAEVSKSRPIYELRNTINHRLIHFVPQIKPQSGHSPMSRNDITEALRCHPDWAYRQMVYEQALRPLAEELEPQVVELMRRRNTEARRLGYTNFADLQLHLFGLNRAELLELFGQLDHLTAAPYRAFLESARREYSLERVEPWDLHWLADQQAAFPDGPFRHPQIIPRIHQLLQAFGLNPEKLPVEVLRRDIPFGGLCFTIRVPDDIRILANPKDGYVYYRTMFHEFGHALHSAFNRQTNYLYKRESGVFNEGMAETLAYFTHYPDWLAQVMERPLAEVAHYRRANRARRLLRIRNLLAQAHFELEAYANPETDLGRLAADYESQYLFTPLNLTPRWAANSFPTTHPVYRQNYLVADLIAAQTHAAIKQQFGSFFSLNSARQAEVFGFLQTNYFGPGASIEWREKIKRATGQPLNPASLVAELEL